MISQIYGCSREKLNLFSFLFGLPTHAGICTSRTKWSDFQYSILLWTCVLHAVSGEILKFIVRCWIMQHTMYHVFKKNNRTRNGLIFGIWSVLYFLEVGNVFYFLWNITRLEYLELQTWTILKHCVFATWWSEQVIWRIGKCTSFFESLNLQCTYMNMYLLW